MSLIHNEFLNKNERRNYPLHSLSDRTDKFGRIMPNSYIVDANIWLPRSAGQSVYLSSVRISKSIISMTFLAASQNPYSTDGVPEPTFVPIAVLRVTRPAVAYKNYALEALYPGVGGWLMLGQGAIQAVDETFSFDDPGETTFIDRCIRAYRDVPVKSLGKIGQSRVLTGLVNLKGLAGSTVTRKETRIIDGKTRDVAVIALDLTNNSVATLEAYAGVCGHRPQEKTCNKQPIEQLNDVHPDCGGNIDIEFKGSPIVGDVHDGLILDFPVDLTTVCPPVPPDQIFIDPQPGDFITPVHPTSSSEAGPPSEPSSSSENLSAEYCESFSGPTNEFTPLIGFFNLQSGRLVSAPSIPTDQVAIDLHRTKDGILGYLLQAIVRPRTTPGSGFLIFAYKSITNFYFAGLSQTASPGFPNGRFFIGQRVAASSADPTDLLPNYKVLVNIPVPAVLPNVDYHLSLQVSKPGNEFLILFQATWNDGQPRDMAQYFAVNLSLFNRFGYTGLGTIASETEFDNFGINCTGF